MLFFEFVSKCTSYVSHVSILRNNENILNEGKKGIEMKEMLDSMKLKCEKTVKKIKSNIGHRCIFIGQRFALFFLLYQIKDFWIQIDDHYIFKSFFS